MKPKRLGQRSRLAKWLHEKPKHMKPKRLGQRSRLAWWLNEKP